MIQPDFKTFARLARQGNLVPVYDTFTADLPRRLSSRYRPVRVPGLPPLIGGAIGYFAYDMVRLIENIPASGADELKLADCVMMFYRGLVAFAHVSHRVWVVQK